MESNGSWSPSPVFCPPNLNSSLTAKVGRVLEVLAHIGDTIKGPNNISSFHSIVPPNIPVHAYYVYVSINSGLSDQ